MNIIPHEMDEEAEKLRYKHLRYADNSLFGLRSRRKGEDACEHMTRPIPGERTWAAHSVKVIERNLMNRK